MSRPQFETYGSPVGISPICVQPSLTIHLYVQWGVAFEWNPAKAKTNFRIHEREV